MRAEDDLDFPPEAEEPAGQVMMHKPVAVRPPANTQWQLTSKDARKANEREKTATGEQTPRFAAARRDFYERAERQSESIVYASSDDGSHPHQLDSILSWQETASGSTSAAVRWPHGSCSCLCMVSDASACSPVQARACSRARSSAYAYIWIRICTTPARLNAHTEYQRVHANVKFFTIESISRTNTLHAAAHAQSADETGSPCSGSFV